MVSDKHDKICKKEGEVIGTRARYTKWRCNH